MRTERNMMRSGHLSVEAATAAVLVAFCLGILTAGYSWDVTGVHRTTVITEDDPRWDCATMGNQVCGPDAGTIPPATYEKP